MLALYEADRRATNVFSAGAQMCPNWTHGRPLVAPRNALRALLSAVEHIDVAAYDSRSPL